MGGQKFKSLQTIVIFFAEIPMNVRDMIEHKTLNLNSPPKLKKHKNKKRFNQFISNKRNALLILPRYDHNQSRSLVDIIDVRKFEVIHTYKHDISSMNDKVQNIKEFSSIKIDNAPVRFKYWHPLVLDDGSLISFGDNAPIFKIDFCSNLEWLNDEEIFHHSLNLDHENNIWAGGKKNPKSKNLNEYAIKGFSDDSIIKINTDGKILYNKSVIEILIENKIFPNNFAFTQKLLNETDPIHLNDIEPALNNSEYWKKGDVFLSARHLSAIIHYRPSTNEVINYIIGPFSDQHDVDIISNKEISIFNNNSSFIENKFSEVVIYNFETKKFSKLFNSQLQKNNFKTHSQGLSHIFKDGALMVEEQNHGRIILFNNKGEKEWELVNKDKNGNIGLISWSRIIENSIFIDKFKSLVRDKKCTN